MVGAVIVKDNHIIGQGYHEFLVAHMLREMLLKTVENPLSERRFM